GTWRTAHAATRTGGPFVETASGFVRRLLTLLYFGRCVRSRPDRNGRLARRPARVHGCSGDARRTRSSAHRPPESRITRTDCTGPVPPKADRNRSPARQEEHFNRGSRALRGQGTRIDAEFSGKNASRRPEVAGSAQCGP